MHKSMESELERPRHKNFVMRFNRLDDWLNWQESLNPAEIDLGLERIAAVLSQAGLSSSFNCPLITVAGTNGKGSVVATLESIAVSAGLNVCSYTSPHLFRYNERIRTNAQAIDDDSLCAAFERIDQARGEVQLTYFEFGTLAAIDLFHQQQADLIILEVGLGGRLDAVNIMDSEVSILTSIAIDHIDWLGDNREAIGFEKAGVFRENKPVICGDRQPPASVLQRAEELHCEFIQVERDYQVVKSKEQRDRWLLKSAYPDIADLPEPALIGEFQKSNVATALMALQTLASKGLLPPALDLYDNKMLSQALTHIELPGRFQAICSQPTVYVDVAHNPAAAKALSSQLKLTRSQSKNQGRTWAITAMLADKDVEAVLESLSDEIDIWCFAGLEDTPRGLSVQRFVENISEGAFAQQNSEISEVTTSDIQHDLMANQCTILGNTIMLANTVRKACELVLSRVNKEDRIIIFGSFYTVAEAMQFFSDLDDGVMGLNK